MILNRRRPTIDVTLEGGKRTAKYTDLLELHIQTSESMTAFTHEVYSVTTIEEPAACPQVVESRNTRYSNTEELLDHLTCERYQILHTPLQRDYIRKCLYQLHERLFLLRHGVRRVQTFTIDNSIRLAAHIGRRVAQARTLVMYFIDKAGQVHERDLLSGLEINVRVGAQLREIRHIQGCVVIRVNLEHDESITALACTSNVRAPVQLVQTSPGSFIAKVPLQPYESPECPSAVPSEDGFRRFLDALPYNIDRSQQAVQTLPDAAILRYAGLLNDDEEEDGMAQAAALSLERYTEASVDVVYRDSRTAAVGARRAAQKLHEDVTSMRQRAATMLRGGHGCVRLTLCAMTSHARLIRQAVDYNALLSPLAVRRSAAPCGPARVVTISARNALGYGLPPVVLRICGAKAAPRQLGFLEATELRFTVLDGDTEVPDVLCAGG